MPCNCGTGVLRAERTTPQIHIVCVAGCRETLFANRQWKVAVFPKAFDTLRSGVSAATKSIVVVGNRAYSPRDNTHRYKL